MRFDWVGISVCVACEGIASLCMQEPLSNANMTKNGLHMHQCVHNYKVDFLATIMDC